jgi:hypothetical protein
MSVPALLPLRLFGAFDRHNFGDLLFPHLLAALLPERSFEFAGLVSRDLQRFGGHRVIRLASVGMSRPAHLIHAGGEVLTCSAWEAAVMLLDRAAAAQAIARYDDDRAAAAAWAASQLGTTRSAPYVVGREFVVPSGKLIFNAVGGVEWASMPTDRSEEVKTALRDADWLSVRDHVTQRALHAEGIVAELCPDPAVMVRTCFDQTIRQYQGELKPVRQAFPRGYLACQFSADFADDASLAALAQQLSRVTATTGMGTGVFSRRRRSMARRPGALSESTSIAVARLGACFRIPAPVGHLRPDRREPRGHRQQSACPGGRRSLWSAARQPEVSAVGRAPRQGWCIRRNMGTAAASPLRRVERNRASGAAGTGSLSRPSAGARSLAVCHLHQQPGAVARCTVRGCMSQTRAPGLSNNVRHFLPGRSGLERLCPGHFPDPFLRSSCQ